MRPLLATSFLASVLLLTTGTAQESAGHLNPVIAKLAAGKTVYDLINTGDLSLATRGRRRARRWTSSTPTWSTARSTFRASRSAGRDHDRVGRRSRVPRFDQIAAVPGVGALFLRAGSDLAFDGVPPSSPEVEGAFQQILKACKAHKVACGITAGNTNDIVRRVKEGWNIIRSNVPAHHTGPHAAGRSLMRRGVYRLTPRNRRRETQDVRDLLCAGTRSIR